MSTLDRSGPQLSSSVSGDWKILYREFFKRQTNFLGWLEKKKIECRAKIYVSHTMSHMTSYDSYALGAAFN